MHISASATRTASDRAATDGRAFPSMISLRFSATATKISPASVADEPAMATNRSRHCCGW